MTVSGSLIAYLQNQWAITVPAATDIKFSNEWYDADYLTKPQVVVYEAVSPELERWTTAGSMSMRAIPRFNVDIGCYIPPGSSGTQEMEWVQNIRKHIADILRYGWGQSLKYGGSLSPLREVLPDGHGRSAYDEGSAPRFERYILTLWATEDM